jgi:hypothetical protein
LLKHITPQSSEITLSNKLKLTKIEKKGSIFLDNVFNFKKWIHKEFLTENIGENKLLLRVLHRFSNNNFDKKLLLHVGVQLLEFDLY